MPLRGDEVDANLPFEETELLFRRVARDGVDDTGTLLPSELNTMSFDKTIDGAPSFLRSAFSIPEDVLHTACADEKDVSNWLAYEISVGALPSPIVGKDNRSFDVFPVHRPLTQCGAHSVIATCHTNDSTRAYTLPPRSVRNDLRARIATRLRPARRTAVTPS